MAEQFYTILTNTGKAKIANSLPTGTKVNLTTLKVGDSNGTYYNPSETQTDLVHTVYSCNVTSVEVDSTNSNWINITSVIPSDQGGFTIREVGVFDDGGNLIAIGKYPETYKPTASDGSTKELYLKMTLEVSNSSSVTLKIDPTVILATKSDINTLTTSMNNSISTINSQLNDMEYYVTPKMFGAVGDGTVDDTESLKNCITYSLANNIPIKSSSDQIYLISETLEVKNANIDLNYATLTSNIDCGALISINYIDNNAKSDYYGSLEKIKFDCSNVDCGLDIIMGRKKNIEKLIFNNIKHYGLNYRGGYEIIGTKLHFTGNGTTNTIAMQCTGGDSQFSDLIIIDCFKAIVNRGFNFYSKIHSWIRTHEIAPTSTMFTCGGNVPCMLSQIYPDTYGVTFEINDAWIVVNQLYLYFNPEIYEESYSAPVLFNVKDGFTSLFQRRSSLSDSDLRGVSNRSNQKLKYHNSTGLSVKVDRNNIYKVDGYNSEVSTSTDIKDYLGNIVEVTLHRRTVKSGFVNINLVLKINTDVSKNFEVCDIPYFNQPNGEYKNFCCWGYNVNDVNGIGSLKITDTISGTIITDDTFTGNRAYIKINATYPIVSEYIEY